MMRPCLVYGAGGHASVVADALKCSGYAVEAFLDDACMPANVLAAPVRAFDPDADKETPVVIGIGNNELRRSISERILNVLDAVIHPSAVVASDVTIGTGTVVLANAVIQAGARIGKHVIINANVCVDHDAIIEDYVHIYPNAYIGGAALIREGVTLQPGAIVARLTEVRLEP